MNPARCSLIGDVLLTNTVISKSKRNRSPTDRLPYIVRSIFQSPLIFKWQALDTVVYRVGQNCLLLLNYIESEFVVH